MYKSVLIFLVVVVAQLCYTDAKELEKINMRETVKLDFHNNTMTEGSKSIPQLACVPKHATDHVCEDYEASYFYCFNTGYKEKKNGIWGCNNADRNQIRYRVEFVRLECEYLPEDDNKTWAIKGSCYVRYTIHDPYDHN